MEIVALFVVGIVVLLILTGVKVVPQAQNYLVERLGRYHRTLEAGLHITIPFYETIRKKVDIIERQLPTKEISAITLDNAAIGIELAILYRIADAARSVYRIQDVSQAIQTSVTGVVRSTIGMTNMDDVQSNRRAISESIEKELQTVTAEWGIVLSRVEVLDVSVDAKTREAMQMQLNSERSRRAVVRQAEGDKESRQLIADADLYTAKQQAEARKVRADADAYAISTVSKAIAESGHDAVEFEIKKLQANAIGRLGDSDASKFILLPSGLVDSFGAMGATLAAQALTKI